MIQELFNGWANYVMGSAIILFIILLGNTLWDIYKYKRLHKKLDMILEYLHNIKGEKHD